MSKSITRTMQSCASWIVINPARLRAIVFVLLMLLALLVVVAPSTVDFAGYATGGGH